MTEQYVEGQMKSCKKYACQNSCCDDDQVEEWVNEYFAFHDRMKDHLTSLDITLKFKNDRVQFKKCSDGRNCKFLTHSLNKDIDPRPIDCKIYPFVVDWDSIDFDKKLVKLYYWDNDCPLVKNKTIPEEFSKEVIHIIKRDFAVLFYGARFEVKIIDKVYKPHLKKK
jgi:Fe-S-cluster containining protein